MSNRASTKTALCLIPPDSVWQQIQALRSVHDKAYPRWMPHINFMYPFVPECEFDNVKGQLELIINKRPPFELEFDKTSLEYFKQKGNECTFHIRPKLQKDVVELQQVIENIVPEYVRSKRPFQAHLTLGQTTTSRISDVLIEIKANWTPIKFTIDRVYMISRENTTDDVFTIKRQILLAGSKEETIITEPVPAVETIPIDVPVVRETQYRSNGKNYLCIVPPYEFSLRLLLLLENTSFLSQVPFRIVLAEFDNVPSISELTAGIASIRKFTLSFGSRAICFNYSTSRLFLKPTSIDELQRLNINQDKTFDGTMTLGTLNKNELTMIGNRFTESWSIGVCEFEVERVHLIDADGRFQHSFILQNQWFSS